MLTGNQIRIARFARRLSVAELADKVGISVRTLKRIEATDGVPSSSAATIMALQACLEHEGIEFIGAPDDAPGIRIHEPASRESAED